MNSDLQERLEATLARVVAMPTVSDDTIACTAAINTLATELSTLGMHVTVETNEHPWLIATTRPTKHPKLLLAAHIDVVPPSTDDHFDLKIEGDKLLGRGVLDMKSGAACFLELAHELAEAGTLQNYDFGILLTTDEEIGGTDGVKDFLQKGWTTDIAFLPDGGGNWQLEEDSKGLLHCILRTKGIPSHASRPWQGKNALTGLLPAVNEIVAKYPNDDKMGTIVSLTLFKGGTAMNQTPDDAMVWFDVRAFTDEAIMGAKDFIQETAKKYGAEFEEYVYSNPVNLDKNNPLVQEFFASYQEVLGRPVEFTKSFAASDARYFTDFGIQSLIMYPVGDNHHGPGEWISRADFVKYYELMHHYVNKVARISAE